MSLFGEDEATVATEMLTENRNDVRKRVLSLIAAHQKQFQERPVKERETAGAKAEELVSQLTAQRHHRVTCPACQCVATVQGQPFGKEHITPQDEEIVVRQSVSPVRFSCSACGLTLESYAEVDTAGLGGHYTRTTRYSPEEYYGLINPENIGLYVEEYLADLGQEYDNE